MKPRLIYILLISAILLNGCTALEYNDYTKTENVGTIAGSALGALAGDIMSDGASGKNKTRAIVGGTAIGMISGHLFAKYLDEYHQDNRESRKKVENSKYKISLDDRVA